MAYAGGVPASCAGKTGALACPAGVADDWFAASTRKRARGSACAAFAARRRDARAIDATAPLGVGGDCSAPQWTQ
ncbi:MAG TPA: hypothetical protein VKU81_03470 [Casimicrobiaceae bacterium]|nr:hypothetical protein [Casimicrobiaceae bacterium]